MKYNECPVCQNAMRGTNVWFWEDHMKLIKHLQELHDKKNQLDAVWDTKIEEKGTR